MAETRKGKPRITKIKGESNRITKYKTAKSKLSRFRQFQERQSKSKKIEREDERRRQEAASKDMKVTQASLNDTSTYISENVCVQPPVPTPSTPKNVEPERESPEPPLQYIQPNEILPYLAKNKGFRIDPRTGFGPFFPRPFTSDVEPLPCQPGLDIYIYIIETIYWKLPMCVFRGNYKLSKHFTNT
ncbi:uncharacterized protein ARB_02043 [Trichophyton benhamiae CBS 112371]|uniref:Uncharacterized protein n=1 Tax=Arthroderma benhamiae (strain ATCC MYA-4681 / CBS 112371) TaxID=663331 RepID=D4B0R7_ARTBC|nr:uncharacterized protein ARB_02043 [Trichophyton benhamiae CBS 112371]EFE31174.1 hypothetical protein ARB_02043 [Trichophyton benhamiae CBS 112371]